MVSYNLYFGRWSEAMFYGAKHIKHRAERWRIADYVTWLGPLWGPYYLTLLLLPLAVISLHWNRSQSAVMYLQIPLQQAPNCNDINCGPDKHFHPKNFSLSQYYILRNPTHALARKKLHWNGLAISSNLRIALLQVQNINYFDHDQWLKTTFCSESSELHWNWSQLAVNSKSRFRKLWIKTRSIVINGKQRLSLPQAASYFNINLIR